MPKSIKKGILVGNVGKDPEVRYSASGTPVANFSLATNEEFKDRHGEWQGRTEWHSVVAWKRLAEVVGEYVAKGSKLYVEGKIQTSSWEDRQSGERKYRTEIVPATCCCSACGKMAAATTKARLPTTMMISVPTLVLAKAGTGIFHSERLRDPAHANEGRDVMSPTNGHANDPANGSVNAVHRFAPPASDTGATAPGGSAPSIPTPLTPTAPNIMELIASLQVPFQPSVIEWRVTNTSKGGSPRGQVIPYADQRAYTDRLNALFTPAGWTRRYAVHTSANFERGKDKKIVAKVLVTYELTILGLGSHSAT